MGGVSAGYWANKWGRYVFCQCVNLLCRRGGMRKFSRILGQQLGKVGAATCQFTVWEGWWTQF